MSNCKADGWSIRTGDENKETWDDENVYFSFPSGIAIFQFEFVLIVNINMKNIDNAVLAMQIK